jgi:hypothetical protein
LRLLPAVIVEESEMPDTQNTPLKLESETPMVVTTTETDRAVVSVPQQPLYLQEEFLNRMKGTGDELADSTVADLLLHHKNELGSIGALLQQIVNSTKAPMRHLHNGEECQELIDYARESSKRPDWFYKEPDGEALLKTAYDLFLEQGGILFSMLGCLSLPALYTCGKGGTPILNASKKFDPEHIRQRITETTVFMFDVMSENGLEPGGAGLQAIQRVRLMHAAIRLLLTAPRPPKADKPSSSGEAYHQKEWPKEWGIPINQEMMGATILTFSWLLLDGLRKLQVNIAEDRQRAYLFYWSLVGHHIGIREEFLWPNVKTMEQAESLYRRIMTRYRSETDTEMTDGRDLTTSLLGYFDDTVRAKPLLKWVKPLYVVPKLLMSQLLDPEDLKLLGVKVTGLEALCMIPFIIVGATIARSQKASAGVHGAKWLTKLTLLAIALESRGDKNTMFEIPKQLPGIKITKRQIEVARKRALRKLRDRETEMVGNAADASVEKRGV